MKLALELLEKGCPANDVLDALGVSRATFYRRLKPRPLRPARPRPPPANRLSDEERGQILSLLHQEEYVDQCPREIVPKLADKGIYLGSVSTMYRVLAEHSQVRERRHLARHPAHRAPILEATGPNQVWTWDITRLPGPYKGKWYFLYLMLDLYSRYVVGWMVATRENARLAQHFIRTTVQKHLQQGQKLTIHSDRGAPMTAGSTRELHELLGVLQSFSRPRTSDDNPTSEAIFKTIKYHSTMPAFFANKEEAQEYFEGFMHWYNHEHMHSGLNELSPATVHQGLSDQVVAARQSVMDAAYARHPERFARGRSRVKTNPQSMGINQCLKAAKVTESSAENPKDACEPENNPLT